MPAGTSWLARADGLRLAYAHQPGGSPTIVFLPGYMSDMTGSKALALAEWAEGQGLSMLRLDYSGCGESEGRFADGTLEIWRDDALHLIDSLTSGPLLIVGSSMGGWLALLIALARPDRIAGLVGIAAAPDFTEWGFCEEEKAALARDGRIEEPSDYSDEPCLTTFAFWRSGQAHLLLDRPIPIRAPVRLFHGQRDPDVPWQTALRIAERVESEDVAVTLVKDGDHRLSRPQDIRLLIDIVAGLIRGIATQPC